MPVKTQLGGSNGAAFSALIVLAVIGLIIWGIVEATKRGVKAGGTMYDGK